MREDGNIHKRAVLKKFLGNYLIENERSLFPRLQYGYIRSLTALDTANYMFHTPPLQKLNEVSRERHLSHQQKYAV